MTRTARLLSLVFAAALLTPFAYATLMQAAQITA